MKVIPLVATCFALVVPNSVRTARAEAPPSTIVVALGPEFTTRYLRYNDALSATLANYSLPIAGGGAGELEVRPFARSSSVARGIFLRGEGHAVLGLSSQLPRSEEKVKTTYYRWAVDLHARFDLAASAAVGPFLGYLAERFDTDAGPGLAAPNLDAKYLRVGVDGRFGLGPVALLAAVAYLPSLGAGPLGDRFRGTSAAALEGTLGVALPLSSHWELRANVDYVRAFFSFEPVPGDPYVAGGALDQTLRGQALAALLF